MKRTVCLVFIFLVSVTTSFSQTLKDFFENTATPLTYLGIDYSKNLVIKDADANTSDIVDRLYGNINNLVVSEQHSSKNYDISRAFNRNNNIDVDITAVSEINSKIDSKNILSSKKSDFKRLKEADIANCVNALNLAGKEGIGLVFIMEGIKKASGKGYGSIWITLIDMKTKAVLMTERDEHEADGIGFRNYWGSVVRRTIMEIDWTKYKEWKKKFTH